MSNIIILRFIACKKYLVYDVLVYFTKDAEDWFGYGKLNVFCHTKVLRALALILQIIMDEQQ